MGTLETHLLTADYVRITYPSHLMLTILFQCWPNFIAIRPECTQDPECPQHLACIREKCKNPCSTNTCGIKAKCNSQNHRAICVCIIGYVGDPYSICEERKLVNIC